MSTQHRCAYARNHDEEKFYPRDDNVTRRGAIAWQSDKPMRAETHEGIPHHGSQKAKRKPKAGYPTTNKTPTTDNSFIDHQAVHRHQVLRAVMGD